ncbi:MAG: hypothetical protein WA347_06880 [Rhabdochlamydiaceae bacterium]|jgi:hypothetical protein
MKKITFFLSPLILAATSTLFAGSNNSNQKGSGKAPLGQMQDQTMNQTPDCSQLTADEQNFANQLMDMNNRSMFCTRFTPQQRQQAMQMMGQTDTSGNMMNADQAVQRVMQRNGMTPMNQTPDCTQLTVDEQNFANQLMDMNNRSMFCTRFTPQQRQQAMQMMGQTNASGTMMNADQSVQNVMQRNGMTPMNQQQRPSTGACPVK